MIMDQLKRKGINTLDQVLGITPINAEEADRLVLGSVA